MNIVTGMHRSGTTYVGRILGLCDKVDVFHEPFNRHFGLKGVKKNYPAVDMQYELGTIEIIKSLERREKREFITNCAKDKPIKKLARKVLGGKTQQQWRRIRLAHLFSTKELVLKDPFLSLSTKTLSEELDYKVLFLYRHPCAVWASIKQMNWKMDLKNFFGDGYPIKIHEDDLAIFCDVWSTICSHNIGINNSNFLFMSHEEICLDPLASFETIFEHFNIPLQENIKSEIKQMSNGTDVYKKSGQLHQFKRNSGALVDSWKTKLNDEEIDYISSHKLTGQLIKRLYER